MFSKSNRIDSCFYFCHSRLKIPLIFLRCFRKSSEKTNESLSELVDFSFDERRGSNEAHRGFDWEVKYIKLPLRFVGLWPLDDNGFVTLKFLICLFLVTSFTLPSIANSVAIVMNNTSTMEQRVNAITEVVPLVYINIQFIIFKHKSSEIGIILSKIHENWINSNKLSTKEKNPMIVYGTKTRLVTGLYMAFIFFSSIGKKKNNRYA